MAKTVVVLGGSYAALQVAHYILKQKIPGVKVIVVSKNSHLYWNIASVRAIIPGILKDEQLFQPLSAAFSRYPSSSYELIIGTADAADFGAKTVTVSPQDGSGIRTLPYDELVLATGTRSALTKGGGEVPWKAGGTYEEVLALVHDTAKRVAAAKHIVVAGAGATGIEVAGELGYEFGRNKAKEIVLLSAGSEILGGDPVAGNARSELKKLGVTIRTEVVVESVRPAADGKTEVVLRDGQTITTDLYLATAGLIPNSEYIDEKFLDKDKLVVVDEFFKVKGAEHVWALGDIVSKPRAGLLFTQKQAGGVAKNVVAVLKGKEPGVIKSMPFDIFACTVGRSGGVGRMGPVKMFSTMVWLAKGRTLGTQMLPSYIDGSVA